MSPERLVSSQQEQVFTPKMSVPASPIPVIPAKEAESPIAFLLAVAQSQVSRSTDDDLTSLSWLHEKDVLKGINLVNPSPSSSVHTTPINATFVQNSSPTSDFMDESSVSAPESTTSSLNSPIPYQPIQQKNKHPYNVPYDPITHVKNKPPYSFSCLIFMAIENSQTKALPVKEIYAWILDHFPYFYNAPTGWKNSVRHNLSLNKCFQKVEKAPNLGKGSLWTVDPQYRPNLMQALTRSFHPSYTLDPNSYFKCGRAPNPELFPYLSQKLHVGDQSDDSLDAVDAAAVMLSLKNGSRYMHKKDKYSHVITNSPSEDHTYSASENMSVSNDEAFESDEERNSKTNVCRKIDFEEEEEQRKIKEGAETLLNLAGISTRRRSNSQGLDNNYHKRRKSNQFTIPPQTCEKPQQFRPRLLRAKKREKSSRYINNNNDINKVAEIEDEWVKHRRELEDEEQKR